MDISVIIPTLNEAENIAETILHAKNNLSKEYAVEFILIDAGSGDDTVIFGKEHVDRIVVDPTLKGAKYKSLNKGAELARGKVLFFLDADCKVPLHFDVAILNFLKSQEIIGGAFEFKMMNDHFIYKIIELINRIRYRITKNYFGDQGLFCNKSKYIEVGGFSNEPIMEAAYLCRKLRKVGKIGLIRKHLRSSVRRFEDGGVVQVFLKDTIIWIQFLLRLDIKRYAADYWAKNENKD
ncbi:MAG: glycosyltransferase family 2 protein [Reichenbachiella sp.]